MRPPEGWADRPDHLRDPAPGADRAAAGRGRGRCAPGARSSCVGATLRDADGEPLIRAHGLAARRAADSRSRPDSPAGRRPGARGPEHGEREAVLRHRPGGRLPHGDGVPVRRRLASPSSGRRPSGCGCATRWSRARSRRRCSGVLTAADSGNGVSATLDLAALPLHQRRPQRPPAPAAGRRVGLPRRDHDPAADRGRARRHRPARRARPDRPSPADAARPRALQSTLRRSLRAWGIGSRSCSR